MHPSSMENMRRCYERFVAGPSLDGRDVVEVLDVGGADVNGSYREIFADPKVRYRVADLVAAPEVDIVLADPYHLPVPDATFDVVISGQMFEHCEFFWLAFREMVRVLRPDGWLVLIAPSAGPVHRYPVDCYRFQPDAWPALARYAECHLVASWLDERGPWHDLVGVFRRTPLPPGFAVGSTRSSSHDPVPRSDPDESNGPAAEATRGERSYREVLARFHRELEPSFYVEIGVHTGGTLALAHCPGVGIDPQPDLQEALHPGLRLFDCTSDEFFERHASQALTAPVNLAFIDGMHLFEYALRDFMNVERHASPAGAVVVDDVHPNHRLQALRAPRTFIWTGDVWKLTACLATYRPDLSRLLLDASPTGLLIVAGLDPDNRTLWENYNEIVHRYMVDEDPPESVLARRGAQPCEGPAVDALLRVLRAARAEGLRAAEVRERLRLAGLRSPGRRVSLATWRAVSRARRVWRRLRGRS